VNAEFNWWLLIVGLVAGGGLVWLVLADWGHQDDAASQRELEAESTWIAEAMQDRGEPVDPKLAEDLLRLHRTWQASTHPRDDDWPPADVDPNDSAVAAMAPMTPWTTVEPADRTDQTDDDWLTTSSGPGSGVNAADQMPMSSDPRGAAPSIRTDHRARPGGDVTDEPGNPPTGVSSDPADPDPATPEA
jgi:hypothetical protein